MWFIRKIFWMFTLPFFALSGVLMFAFPEEMKEFKKDLIDMFEDSWVRYMGFAFFIGAMVHIARIFDGKHTTVRLSNPNID